MVAQTSSTAVVHVYANIDGRCLHRPSRHVKGPLAFPPRHGPATFAAGLVRHRATPHSRTPHGPPPARLLHACERLRRSVCRGAASRIRAGSWIRVRPVSGSAAPAAGPNRPAPEPARQDGSAGRPGIRSGPARARPVGRSAAGSTDRRWPPPSAALDDPAPGTYCGRRIAQGEPPARRRERDVREVRHSRTRTSPWRRQRELRVVAPDSGEGDKKVPGGGRHVGGRPAHGLRGLMEAHRSDLPVRG